MSVDFTLKNDRWKDFTGTGETTANAEKHGYK